MSNFLLTSDLHFTDHPRDDYRFGLFAWLKKQQKEQGVDATFILGDITDHKDKHSSSLVNKVVYGLKTLKPPVYILMGNHDYIDPNLPFFYFLHHTGIQFYHHPSPIDDFKVYLIPHQPDQAALDDAFSRVPAGWAMMCHQTFTGAVNETGGALTGFKLPSNNARAIYAGDVHAPQCLSTDNGDVIYCGSPYHVRFGDNFTPRVLLLKHGEHNDLHYPAPRKIHCTIRDVSELKLKPGDQVKVTMELTREEAVGWENHKAAIYEKCQALGAGVYGTEFTVPQTKRFATEKPANKTNSEYFATFCSAEKVPSVIKKAGESLL